MATRTDPTFVDPSGDVSPGERLRKARQAADLSVRDIATTLRLEQRTISALESDSFDELPAPTFVRGYLRGYARAVGLAPEPLLDLYERLGFTPPAIIPDPVEKTQAHASDLVFRLTTFAIGAGLLVLVVLWWNSQDFGVPGIDGDLIGWSSDTEEDTDLPDTQDDFGPATTGDADTSADVAGAPVTGTADVLTYTLDDTASAAPEEFAAPQGTIVSGVPVQEVAVPADSGAEFLSGPNPVVETGTASGTESGAAVDAAAGTDSAAADGSPVGTDSVAAADSPLGTDSVAAAATTSGTEPGGEPQGAVETDSIPGADPVVEADVSAEDAAAAASAPDTVASAVDQSIPGTDETPVAGAAIEPQTTADADSAAEEDQVDAADAVAEADSVEESTPDATADTDDSGAAIESASAASTADPQPDDSGTSAALPDEGATGDDSVPPATLPTSESELTLEFVHESWVEIYDSNRTRLFFGLVRPGGRLQFVDTAPFDILLGYAPEARITIDGVLFDHAPYINHGVARFTLKPPAVSTMGDPAPDETDSEQAAPQPSDGRR